MRRRRLRPGVLALALFAGCASGPATVTNAPVGWPIRVDYRGQAIATADGVLVVEPLSVHLFGSATLSRISKAGDLPRAVVVAESMYEIAVAGPELFWISDIKPARIRAGSLAKPAPPRTLATEAEGVEFGLRGAQRPGRGRSIVAGPRRKGLAGVARRGGGPGAHDALVGGRTRWRAPRRSALGRGLEDAARGPRELRRGLGHAEERRRGDAVPNRPQRLRAGARATGHVERHHPWQSYPLQITASEGSLYSISNELLQREDLPE